MLQPLEVAEAVQPLAGLRLQNALHADARRHPSEVRIAHGHVVAQISHAAADRAARLAGTHDRRLLGKISAR